MTPSASQAASPTASSPTTSLSRPPKVRKALDVLATIIKTKAAVRSVTIPVEVRANGCALLSQAGSKSAGEEGAKVRSAMSPVLEDLSKDKVDEKSKEGMLVSAAKKALEAWA